MKEDIIPVFEHDVLRVGQTTKNGVVFEDHHLRSLELLAGVNGLPFYTLVNRGVRFNEHVGVISLGKTIIEILPKVDRKSDDHEQWQRVLVQMLKETGYLRISSMSEASRSLKSNSILDLYIELFIQEVEFIVHSGLVKKYRRIEGNAKALKGPLQFSKHINHNLVHQYRFYVCHQTYDVYHLIHRILYKTLKVLPGVTTNTSLLSRVRTIEINFPELSDLVICESTFNNLTLDRKTERYHQAIKISKLLLLNYHPDVRNGSQPVLAILFDMNALWEKYVSRKLREYKHPSGAKVCIQNSTKFWNSRTVRPDIVIEINGEKIVIDTKWKIPNGGKPSDDDLKQIFVYNQYYTCRNSFLLYPYTSDSKNSNGVYHKDLSQCTVSFINVTSDKALNKHIAGDIFKMIGHP